MRHRRRYLVYGLLFLLLVINYMDRTALSVAIIPIQHDLHLSPAMTGVVLSSFLWAYVLCVVPSGILVDRIGTRMTNTLSITVWSLAAIATGFAGGLVALLSTRVVMGLGESATYPACGRITREWAPEGERGRATAIFNAGAYAGPAVGSLLAAWLLSQHGWHVMFWVVGVIGLVWLVPWLVWFRLPEHSRWLTNSERDHITARRGTPARDAATGATGAPALRALARQRTIWVLAIAQGTAGYTQYLFLTWLPSYLEHTSMGCRCSPAAPTAPSPTAPSPTAPPSSGAWRSAPSATGCSRPAVPTPETAASGSPPACWPPPSCWALPPSPPRPGHWPSSASP
jgi:ACS family glucarate transporter-like MFS transporter